MILLMHVLSMLLCNVSDSELKLWKKKSCYKDTDGLWKSLDGRIAVPKIAYEPLFAYVHGLTHVNYKGIYEYIAKLFFTIGLEQQARNVWPEAFPARNENAQTVVKRLMEHIIPRFGISMAIDSDNGTPFTSRVTKLIAKAIGINATFHIPYHPQSSGQVECTNRTIKDKLIKVHKSKQMNWIEALPLVLMSMRAIPSRTTVKEKPAVDLTKLQKIQQDYVKNLYAFVSEYSNQVTEKMLSPAEEATHSFQPGDYVLVRSLGPGEPRYGPPTQVLLVTRTAVKVKGQQQWIHASRIRAARGTHLQEEERGRIDKGAVEQRQQEEEPAT
ncbi:hypothetical protein F2P81_024055 [Scophthalmus maximus]|uniref:Integrase catalytic domain-containing protein n=1 Tax=Scophthalmus maximus TaxID=52904 RepID=A0A6A4RTB5_SCOMX|nr:hypothetical protein F2P81_024055 [Scophthalmus maximus]